MAAIRSFVGLLCLIVCCWGACKEPPKRDITEYYFPIGQLKAGKVYEYATTGISEDTVPEYWYYKTFQRDSGIFFAATFYDQSFRIGQIAREKMVPSGALARECFLYEPDTITKQQAPVPVSIESPHVFPFKIADTAGIFLYKLQYHPIWEPEATVTLVRNRRFLGDGPPFVFKGRRYPCVRFDIREKISNDQDPDSDVEGYGEEWYAKGLGLVYSRKTYGAGDLTLENRLIDIFPMTELERRAKMVYE